MIQNAQWPNISHESKQKSSDESKVNGTPLDPIEEEKRVIIPNTDEPAVIEILTIEITEIPIVDEAVFNLQNNKNSEEDGKAEDEKNITEEESKEENEEK